MEKTSTLTTYHNVVHLVKAYCTFNNLKMKDYVAEVLGEDLKDFEGWMKKECRV